MSSLPPSEPVDTSSLLVLRQLQRPGAVDAVGRIVDKFFEETPQRLASLRAAVERHDAHQLEQAAHALYGITGTVGANEMSDLSRELEQLGRSGTTDGALALVIGLEAALVRAKPIYQELKDAA
jgi:HPt (histidine-containing phosphotransfer) domain-containing protein